MALGSVCAYPSETPIPFRESDLWNGYPEPTNAPYGIAKRALWTLLDACHRQYGLASSYLMPTNLYGPYDNFDLETSHVIPAMIRKFSECEVEVTNWGSGFATRDFLFVEDCAEAIVLAAERIEAPEPINLGTGEEWYMVELSNIVSQSVTGYARDVHWDKTKPDGQMARCLDVSRAKELLDWEATTSIHEGIRRTVEWWVHHKAPQGIAHL